MTSHAEPVQDWANVATAAIDQADTNYRLGNLAAARRVLREALDIVVPGDEWRYERARLLVALGEMLAQSIFLDRGDPDEALSILAEAEKIASTIESNSLAADVLVATGRVNYFKAMRQGGSFRDALPYYDEALALRRIGGDPCAVSESIFLLGLIWQWEDMDRAEPYFKEALEVARQAGCKLEESYSIRHLGFVAQNRGDLDAARQMFERSLELREELDFRVLLPFSHNAVADVYAELGRTDEAATHHKQAVELAEQIGLGGSITLSHMGLGDFLAAQGDSAAQLHLERALQAATSADLPKLREMLAGRLAEVNHAQDGEG